MRCPKRSRLIDFLFFFNCGIVCLFSLTFSPVMNVRDLIYPSETALEGDSQQGHKAYTRSHNAYLFGKMNKKICMTHQAFTATNYILSLYPSVMTDKPANVNNSGTSQFIF